MSVIRVTPLFVALREYKHYISDWICDRVRGDSKDLGVTLTCDEKVKAKINKKTSRESQNAALQNSLRLSIC